VDDLDGMIDIGVDVYDTLIGAYQTYTAQPTNRVAGRFAFALRTNVELN
jgi:hypothetical protein